MYSTGDGQCWASRTFTPPQRTSAGMEVRAMRKKGQIKNRAGHEQSPAKYSMHLDPLFLLFKRFCMVGCLADSESWLFTLGGRQ